MKSHTSILVSVNLTKGGMPVFFFNYFYSYLFLFLDCTGVIWDLSCLTRD